MLNTVKKIGPVLDLFTPERPEWTMTEIARALDMPKSSAHSLVATLADIGLLSLGPGARYRLGWHLLSLAERMRAALDFTKHAVPCMQELQSQLRETVLLAALDRHEVVYVERVEGTHPMVRLAGVRVGSRAPAHCTAVGKVLLAYREPDEVRVLMRHAGLRALTRNTITDLDAFEAELVTVRARGFAYDLQEIVADVSCIAAPIFDRHGTVIAAMSVAMPAYRFERNHSSIVEPVQKAAQTISDRVASAQSAPPEPVSIERSAA